jgi:formate hydrogenlyase subunit 6/NADH:ubiquinone oxidoreductase subunit I
MRVPGKMLRQVLSSVLRKPATVLYPFVKAVMPRGFRGKLLFRPERCIGCKLCMRDCPANAICIRKVGNKLFEADINLAQCIYCGQCVDSCVKKALEMTPEFELAQLDRKVLNITYAAAAPAPAPAPTAEPAKPAAADQPEQAPTNAQHNTPPEKGPGRS